MGVLGCDDLLDFLEEFGRRLGNALEWDLLDPVREPLELCHPDLEVARDGWDLRNLRVKATEDDWRTRPAVERDVEDAGHEALQAQLGPDTLLSHPSLERLPGSALCDPLHRVRLEGDVHGNQALRPPSDLDVPHLADLDPAKQDGRPFVEPGHG